MRQLGRFHEIVDENGLHEVDYKRMHSELAGEDQQHHQKHTNSGSSRRYVVACALFVSLNSVILGYDGGVMSGAIIFIHEDLKITEVQQEALVGCLSIVSLIGSLAGGRSSDAIGRKWTMALGAVIFQIGCIIMTLAPSYQTLMLGRLLSGIGVGFGTSAMGVYIAEISPAISRGFLTTFPEIFINIGILLGYVSNYAFSSLPNHINWRVMLGIGIIPSIIIGFALLIIPESPRWLVVQNRVGEARSVLMKTIVDEKEVDDRLTDIQLAAAKKSESKAICYELFKPSPMVARMLAAGIGLQCFQQITGNDALIYYSPTIFREAGIEDKTKLLAATIAVGVTKTSFIFVALFLIDKVGRKPLLYISTVGMTVCLLGLSTILPSLDKGSISIAVAVISVCGNVAFFSMGIGPICWVLNSEIFPLRLRAQAVSLGFVGNRVFSGIVTLSFLSVVDAISMAGVFLAFSVLSVVSVGFVYFVVPETKGKTLEEIELLFGNKLPWNVGVPEALTEEDSEKLLPKD